MSSDSSSSVSVSEICTSIPKADNSFIRDGCGFAKSATMYNYEARYSVEDKMGDLRRSCEELPTLSDPFFSKSDCSSSESDSEMAMFIP